MAASPEDAERYQLDLWLNPPGFLKAARLPGANPKAIWRWEQIEMGRDGNVVRPEKMHVVSITMLGKYRVEATINPQNQIQRIKTTVSEPALGDFNIEHESTEQMTFGDVKWPINWHSHQGWDDNWQFDNASTGHNAYGGKFPNVQPNVCGDPVPVPDSVRQATWPAEVTVEKMAEGVYRLGGATHNSYLVEFSDFVAVFEAPTERGPQPGGDRAGRQAGARQADPLADQLASALRPHRRAAHLPAHRLDHRGAPQGHRLPEPRRAVLPPAHGGARHRRRYGRRPSCRRATTSRPSTRTTSSPTTAGILRVYYVQPLQHVPGMLMAYLPAERIAFQADLFDTHEPPPAAPTPAMRSLFNQVQRMKLDIATLAPVHGAPVPWGTFVKAMGH